MQLQRDNLVNDDDAHHPVASTSAMQLDSSVTTPNTDGLLPSTSLQDTPTRTDGTRDHPQYYLKATLLGHTKAVSCVRFSPDCSLLVSAGADGIMLLYNVEDCIFLRSFEGHAKGINDVVWSPDGKYLASGSDDKSLRVWQGQVKRLLNGHTSFLFCLCYNPQGSVIATGSFDETIRLWDVRQAKCIRTIAAHSDPISAVQYNFDGTMLVSCSHDGLIRLWNASTGLCIKTLVDNTNPPLSAVRFSPNGRFILACTLDSLMRIWGCTEERLLKVFSGHTNVKYSIMPCFLEATSTDPEASAFIMCGSEDGKIYIWDIQNRQVVASWQCHSDALISLDVTNADRGSLIATAGLEKDLTVKIWSRVNA